MVSPVARGLGVVVGLAAYFATLVWNLIGDGVRALLDAEADGSLCGVAAGHLGVTVATAAFAAVMVRLALDAREGAVAVSLGLLGVLLAIGLGTLEADSISSLGFFAENEQCAAVRWSVPIAIAAFGAVTAGLVSWKLPTSPAAGGNVSGA